MIVLFYARAVCYVRRLYVYDIYVSNCVCRFVRCVYFVCMYVFVYARFAFMSLWCVCVYVIEVTFCMHVRYEYVGMYFALCYVCALCTYVYLCVSVV